MLALVAPATLWTECADFEAMLLRRRRLEDQLIFGEWHHVNETPVIALEVTKMIESLLFAPCACDQACLARSRRRRGGDSQLGSLGCSCLACPLGSGDPVNVVLDVIHIYDVVLLRLG